MNQPVDEKNLDGRLASLESARGWTPRLISKLEALIRNGDDAELFRINPYRFAASKNAAESEVVDLFLHATVHRLFTMDWLVFCPGCSGSVESFRNLHVVHNQFHCSFCAMDWQTTLDDFIAVVFTVAPDIRDIIFNHPESLSPEDYFFRYSMTETGVVPGIEQPFVDLLRGVTKALDFLPPQSVTVMEIEAVEGRFVKGWSMESEAKLDFTVTGAPTAQRQSVPIRFDGRTCVPAAGCLAPGKVGFAVENATDLRGILAISLIPEDFDRLPLVFAPFLSGKRLVTTQTFRDLFRSEVVGGSEGLGVRDVTLLFTDLKGSTALYDRIGDLNAFALVQQHFERLRDVTAHHGGAVVKTIGDAVMATFADPANAVSAALSMLREIATFNNDAASRDLVLKIGIHRGAAIAVTLNDRLDYFGQTVNIAARVQGLADSDEIYLSADVHDADGVAALLTAFTVEPHVARLKGVGQEMAVYRVAPAR